MAMGRLHCAACLYYIKNNYYHMVAKSIGDDTNYKQLLILPFDN